MLAVAAALTAAFSFAVVVPRFFATAASKPARSAIRAASCLRPPPPVAAIAEPTPTIRARAAAVANNIRTFVSLIVPSPFGRFRGETIEAPRAGSSLWRR